jgi:deferrochelatase/peroxidase EfeB
VIERVRARHPQITERGAKCPLGAHARRMNPRDAQVIDVPRLHRMIRRSTSYGPMLPTAVLEDDGADRGVVHRGAEYFFIPGLRALRWLADDTRTGGKPRD